MRHRNVLAPGVLLLTVVAAVGLWAASRSDEPVAPLEEASAPGGSSAMITHIDPATGKITSAPVSGAALDSGVFDSSHEGLVERPSTTPGGGVGFDTNGRFRSTMSVTLEGEKATVQCEHDGAADAGAGGGQ